jgi:hypothetical protein
MEIDMSIKSYAPTSPTLSSNPSSAGSTHEVNHSKPLFMPLEMVKISAKAYWYIFVKSPTLFFDSYLHVLILCLGGYLMMNSDLFDHYDASHYRVLSNAANELVHGCTYVTIGLAGLLLDLFLIRHRLSRVLIRGCESFILVLWTYSLLASVVVPVSVVFLLVLLMFNIVSLLRI